MQDSLSIDLGNSMMHMEEFLDVPEVSLKTVRCFWDGFVMLVCEEVLLMAHKARYRSSELLMRPACLSRERVGGLFVEEVPVAFKILLEPYVKGVAVCVVQTLHKREQDGPRFRLWVSGGPTHHESFHVHMTHLVGNAMKG